MAKKENDQVCFRTMIGGQALMEGILMRGPDKQAIVCRTENGKVSNKNYYLQLLNLSYYPKREPAMCVKAGLSAQASAVFIR